MITPLNKHLNTILTLPINKKIGNLDKIEIKIKSFPHNKHKELKIINLPNLLVCQNQF